METRRIAQDRTRELRPRKISLAKVEETSADRRGHIVGWEYNPPRRGERYTVNLGQGRVLRTSPVQEVSASDKMLLVKTVNSTYCVAYLED
jgi:hypothetical protein